MSDEQVETPPDEPAGAGVPGSPRESEELLAERPPGWEYMLFAGVLLQGKSDLELQWRDHELRLPTASYHRVDEEHVATYLSEAFGRLSWTIEPLSRVFAGQEDAFGKPGEPGNPALIEHFARWIISTYRRLLEWAGTVRSAGVPEGFEQALELSAQAADVPIRQIRDFLDETVTQVRKIPEHFATPQGGESEPLRIELTLTLTADEPLMEEAIAELRRALGQQA